MERPRKSTRPLPPRKIPTECLCCGAVNPWVINKVEFVAPFRDTEHCFRAEANQCRHCDAIATTPEQVEAISGKVRDAHKTWISQKFKQSCRELGVSIRELVNLTGIPFATLARASSGESLIEATVEKLLWIEIERLTEESRTARWMKMEPQDFRVMNGSVVVKTDPRNARVYSGIWKTATQSSLGNSHDFGQEECFSKQCYSNLVTA